MTAPLSGEERNARWREIAQRVGQGARALGRRVRRSNARSWAYFGCALAAVWIARLEFRLAGMNDELGRSGERPSGLVKEVDRASEDARVALELARAAHHATRSLESNALTEDGSGPSDLDGRALDRATIAEELARSTARLVELADDRSIGAQRIARTSTAESERAVAVSVGAATVAELAAQLANEAWLSAVPVGTILPWDPVRRDRQGLPIGRRELPEGWAVCDGTAGTPDLTHRFLRGAQLEGAGEYAPASAMTTAGRHAHAADAMVNSHQWFKEGLAGLRKRAGEGLLLLDREAGVPAAQHGEHVHLDANVPAHFTVLFIQRVVLPKVSDPGPGEALATSDRARPREAAARMPESTPGGLDSPRPTEPGSNEDPLEVSGG